MFNVGYASHPDVIQQLEALPQISKHGETAEKVLPLAEKIVGVIGMKRFKRV